MGGGIYSSSSRGIRMAAAGTYTKSVRENFERSVQREMSPLDVMRESCDSDEHPNTIPIIVGLDVTGSMGKIPQMFLLEGLPTLMDTIFKAGVKDPQICFIAIGDHEYDDAPLQVGQFESSDELVDKWLQKVWPEGGGGGNGGESYSLAWLFGAYQTKLDSLKKRGQKGFLFTIGDEPFLPNIPAGDIKHLTGLGDVKGDSESLLKKAEEMYHVFHIHLTETGTGASFRIQGKVKELLGDKCMLVHNYTEIPKVIANKIIEILGTKQKVEVTAEPTTNINDRQDSIIY